MEVYPVRIEHAQQFGSVLESIAKEDRFLKQSESMSPNAALRFVERQLVDDVPMFVAIEGEQLIGWCEVSLSDLALSRHNGLLSMGVLDGFRKQGIGSRLINKCLAAARSAGFERVELSVLESNKRAQSFYLSKDFVVEGIKNKSLKKDNQYFNEVLMAKEIASPCMTL